MKSSISLKWKRMDRVLWQYWNNSCLKTMKAIFQRRWKSSWSVKTFSVIDKKSIQWAVWAFHIRSCSWIDNLVDCEWVKQFQIKRIGMENIWCSIDYCLLGNFNSWYSKNELEWCWIRPKTNSIRIAADFNHRYESTQVKKWKISSLWW